MGDDIGLNIHKMQKGRNKPGSHSHFDINSFMGDFFLLEKEVLFEFFEGGHELIKVIVV